MSGFKGIDGTCQGPSHSCRDWCRQRRGRCSQRKAGAAIEEGDGGSFPAYPSGKTWDEPSGKTGSGKKFFHNIIPGSQVPTEPFYDIL